MKYMLSIQHTNQRVTYIQFNAHSDDESKQKANHLLNEYKNTPRLVTSAGKPYGTINGAPVWYSGNHNGHLPPNTITDTWLSKWVESDTACNAWGASCGGYWGSMEKESKDGSN